MSPRIPIYAAERRLVDAAGHVLGRQDAYGFRPFPATVRTSEFGAVRTDAAPLARLAIVVPAAIEASLQEDGAELLLVLRDCGRIFDMLAAREAVEAAAEGRHGLSLSRVAPAPCFSPN